MRKQSKKRNFIESVLSLNGAEKEYAASQLGITLGTLEVYMDNIGAGTLHIKDGKIQVDPEWEEVRQVSDLGGSHIIENLYVASDDSARSIRRQKEENYTDPHGLSGRIPNFGSAADSSLLINSFRYLEDISLKDEKNVLDDISRNGSVGAERLG